MLLTSIETRGAGDFSPAHDSYPLEEFRALLYNNVRQRDYLAPNGYEVEVGSL